MPETSKLKCADCGVDMNHHADKVDYSGEIRAGGAADLGLGGVLQEVHSCPGCGKTALRIAS
jgi:ribosomal protein S27AE